jgi:V8-like Glu-specific endopeptidase
MKLRNTSTRRSLSIIGLAVAAAGLLGPATAASAAPSGTVATHVVADQGSAALEAVHAFWTPDRLHRARSLDGSTIPAGAAERPAASTLSTATTSTAAARAGYVPIASPPLLGFVHAGVTSTVGRVFFTDSAGTLLSCSASTVASLSQNMVMTAGHCVYGGPSFDNDGTKPRAWYQNMIYFPGVTIDANGGFQAPYGGWAVRSTHALSGWITSASLLDDVGIMIVETHGIEHLVTKVGGNGLTWDQPIGVQVRSYGYPGETMTEPLRTCDDVYMLYAGGGSFADIRCDMGRGSSGGPWLMNQDVWGIGYITGVNSLRIDGTDGSHLMYSPYFDNRVVDLYVSTRSL